MRKSSYFDSQEIRGWPDPRELKPYFYAPPGEEWFHTGGNDSASIEAIGVEGTDDLPQNK